MISTFDATAILAYKIMKEYDIHTKTTLSKEELQDYFVKVLKIANEVGCDYEKISEDQILEIKDRLRFFCKIKDDGIGINSDKFKAKGRSRASIYVQRMDGVLFACCMKIFKIDLLKKDDVVYFEV